MSSRIVSRGQNHQSLRAGESHEAIIWQFLGQHEEFDQATNAQSDGKFDRVIEMKPEWEREEALAYVIEQLMKVEGMGIVDPGEERRREAVEFAKEWKVKNKKETSEDSSSALKKRQQKPTKPRYYGLRVEVNLGQLVRDALPEEELSNPASLWNHLVKSSRVELHPHVTLVHQVELQSQDPEFKEKKRVLWDKYEGMVQHATREGSTPEDKQTLEVKLTLGPRLVWNDRAMSIEVSSLSQPESTSTISLVEDRSAHITVGTRASDIRPIEGKFLMEKALKVEKEEGIKEIRIDEIKVKARLDGLS